MSSRRFRLKLIVASFSLLLSLLAAEAALRLARISFPPFHQIDRTLGWILRPNTSGWFHHEGDAWVSINSDGLRDREHTAAKPPGVIRIAVLGDSFGWGVGVDVRDAFPSVIERSLPALRCAGAPPVEVINFSVDDYGTAQQLLTLRQKVWRYQPDVILLAFFPGNDIANNRPELNGGYRCPYFFESGGRLVLDDSFLSQPGMSAGALRADSVAGALVRRSALLQLANGVRKSIVFDRKTLEAEEKDRRAGAPIIDNLVFLPPAGPVWSAAWSVTERILLEMRDESAAHGARLHIALVTHDAQIHSDARVRQSFLACLGAADFDYPYRRVRDFARSARIPLTDLAPAMLQAAESRRHPLHGLTQASSGFGHWNAEGHRIAGELIAQGLLPTLSGSTSPCNPSAK